MTSTTNTTAEARTLRGQWLGEGLGFLEGPVLTATGTLVVTSISLGEIWEFQADGTGAKILEAEGGVNGLTVDAQGRLYGTHIWHTHPVPEHKKTTGGIVTWDEDGTFRFLSRDPISPNDLCFGPDGMLYLTDPTRDRGWDDGRIFRLDPSGERPAELLLSVPWFPNGIGFTGRENELLVADSGGARLLTYDLVDGQLENERVFAAVAAGGVPDGFAFDTEGNVLVCCPVIDDSGRPSTLQVFSPDGELLDISVPNPDSTHTTNVLLTEDGQLYITDADKGSVLRVPDWPGAPGAPLYPFRDR